MRSVAGGPTVRGAEHLQTWARQETFEGEVAGSVPEEEGELLAIENEQDRKS